MSKISIRFFGDKQVRAVWNEGKGDWFFSVVDIVGILTDSLDARKYWSVLKSRLNKRGSQLTTKCSQLKLLSSDGKRYLTDCLSQRDMLELIDVVPSDKSTQFVKWFVYSSDSIDGQSKQKAYSLFESGILDSLEAGTTKALQQIHAYIFGGLFDFAGQLRTKNISKDGFTFAPYQHFSIILPNIDRMPETSLDEIVDKYIEMNVAHSFMEGNGRSTRIWLDLMLKRTLKKTVDWSKIDKKAYLSAMKQSVDHPAEIKMLIQGALTSKITDRETFMKGIDYSYYYEE